MKIKLTIKQLPLGAYLIFVIAFISACTTSSMARDPEVNDVGSLAVPTAVPQIAPTAFPTRPTYYPGELVEYEAQPGDNLPALAARFNTSIEEILTANPIIPDDATTMPPGLPMQIPIYYRPFWGSPHQIIPDSHYVNGPAAASFNTSEFVNRHPGWLKDYVAYAAEQTRTGAGIVDYVATNFSISPMVLLALLEYQSNALSSQILAPEARIYPLGYENVASRGLYLQLVWAANILNNGYYAWRTGSLTNFERPDGRIEQPDPWQNAASVALQIYFNQALPAQDYVQIIGSDGFSSLYSSLFGNGWEDDAHIPGSLTQPVFQLPFEPNKQWTLTGGPHVGWGRRDGIPFVALDFAPPSITGGCVRSDEWATAIAGGVVVRSERGRVALDLDGDGDERTGWVIFYLHIETRDRAPVGAVLEVGESVGHPSCEGGIATGSHVHIARKYNGEWMPAAGVVPFIMENWIPFAGSGPYLGGLTRFGETVTACECSSKNNQLSSNIPETNTP